MKMKMKMKMCIAIQICFFSRPGPTPQPKNYSGQILTESQSYEPVFEWMFRRGLWPSVVHLSSGCDHRMVAMVCATLLEGILFRHSISTFSRANMQ